MVSKNKEKSRDVRIEELCERIINDLKDLREKEGFTVAKLAEETGIQQPNITRLETGGSGEKPQRPNLKTLIIVADALGADIKVVKRKESK